MRGQLSLDMKYQLKPQLPTKLIGVIQVPISMDINVLPGNADKSYLRMLEFMRGLIDEAYYLEISESILKSNGKGVQSMNLLINIWLKDELGIAKQQDSITEVESADIPVTH